VRRGITAPALSQTRSAAAQVSSGAGNESAIQRLRRE
jgi:hypothetical protein